MRTFGIILGGFVVFAAVLALGVGTRWFGLVAARPMVQYQAETDRLRWENSASHQEGASQQIGDYCSNMENVSNSPVSRHAFAGMIVRQADAYAGSGPLSPDAQNCVTEAHQLLTQPLPAAANAVG